MKDVFIPVAYMEHRMRKGDKRLVMLVIDAQTGRVTATEKIDQFLTNLDLAVKEGEEVDLLIFQKTDIGYKVIINSKHTGVLHYNEVFKDLETGEKLRGYIKKIRPGNKIDVSPGVKGYGRVMSEEEKVLEVIRNNNGYIPYNDKSDPESIYAFLGMSKKTFKMILGALYKKRLIEFTQTGTKLVG
jgi:predicted RNA-binding protein (virulence factor B family)